MTWRARLQGAWAPLLGACTVLALGATTWSYSVDDAFIVARYADRILAGLGYTMVDGPPSDGVTGPLWLLPMLLAGLLGLRPLLIAKLLGLLCMAAAVALVLHSLRSRQGGRVAQIFALLFLAPQLTLAVWGAAGLETGLATLLFTLAALGAIRRPAPSPRWVGGALGALAWLRPELALAAAVLLAGLWARAPRAGAIALGLSLFGAISLLTFRVALFGHPLPLSFLAKPGDLGHGLSYLVPAILVLSSGIGLALVALSLHPRWGPVRSTDRWLGLCLLSHALAVLLAGGDWMPGYRLLAPMLPISALLIGIGAARLRRRGWGGAARGSRRARSWMPWALAPLLVALPLLDLVVQLPEIREAARLREEIGRPLADSLGRRYASIALIDVGFLGRISGLEIVDLGGITDPAIAACPGGHLSKEIPLGLLAARDPDAILLHSTRRPVVAEGRLRALWGYPVERRLARLPWAQERYRVVEIIRYAPEYWYVLLERRAPMDP